MGVSAGASDFRAPPPSPVGTGRRSSVTNDDVLTEFLEHSLRVPDLILPDNIFPRQKFLDSPPTIDLRSLRDGDSVSKIFESFSGIGCFQLTNHGVSPDLIKSATTMAAGIFRVSPEQKASAARTPEKPCGFEEIHGGDEEGEMGEEFVWCGGDEGLKADMEGIWPLGYSNFSGKMESLSSQIDEVARQIMATLREDYLERLPIIIGTTKGRGSPPICYVHKHCRDVSREQWVRALRYDVIRMLIRGADFSHTLCAHVVCDVSLEFHVYSKKGWVSFCPDPNALIITPGDQIQAWSGGKYKHVLGRPIYKGDEEQGPISMAFLCSPPIIITATASSSSISKDDSAKTISLAQQAMVALFSIFLYHFLLYLCT